MAVWPSRCLNVCRNLGKGKARTLKNGPGGTREAVGGLSPRSPARARPGRFGTSSTRAARRLSKGRPRRAPGLLWEGNTKEREKHVFRFDGGGRQFLDAWASQELTEPGRLASASEHSVSREGAAALSGTHPGRADQARGSRPEQMPGRLQDARGHAPTARLLFSMIPGGGRRTQRPREMSPATDMPWAQRAQGGRRLPLPREQVSGNHRMLGDAAGRRGLRPRAASRAWGVKTARCRCTAQNSRPCPWAVAQG